jgi:hypothetical protein
MKWTLRDLFWLVLVVAVGCAIAVYSGHRVMPPLVEIATQLCLVAAGAILAGRYVSKAPFSAGLVVGVVISLLFRELQGNSNPISYLFREWILPKATTDWHIKSSVAVRAAILIYGMLAGLIAVGVSRRHRE